MRARVGIPRTCGTFTSVGALWDTFKSRWGHYDSSMEIVFADAAHRNHGLPAVLMMVGSAILQAEQPAGSMSFHTCRPIFLCTVGLERAAR